MLIFDREQQQYYLHIFYFDVLLSKCCSARDAWEDRVPGWHQWLASYFFQVLDVVVGLSSQVVLAGVHPVATPEKNEEGID